MYIYLRNVPLKPTRECAKRVRYFVRKNHLAKVVKNLLWKQFESLNTLWMHLMYSEDK